MMNDKAMIFGDYNGNKNAEPVTFALLHSLFAAHIDIDINY